MLEEPLQKIKNANYLPTNPLLKLLPNLTNCFFLTQCAQYRCVELRYGISLTESGRSYVEIEENEVYVG